MESQHITSKFIYSDLGKREDVDNLKNRMAYEILRCYKIYSKIAAYWNIRELANSIFEDAYPVIYKKNKHNLFDSVTYRIFIANYINANLIDPFMNRMGSSPLLDFEIDNLTHDFVGCLKTDKSVNIRLSYKTV